MLLALDNCEHLLEACARLCQRLLAAAPDLSPGRHQPRAAAGRRRDGLAGPAAGRRGGRRGGGGGRPAVHRPGGGDRSRVRADPGQRGRGGGDLPVTRRHTARRSNWPPPGSARCRWSRSGCGSPTGSALLTTGDRAAAPRQQTLRAAIDWSHDLLTAREQALLRRLSVFAGWSLEMAEQVCTDELVPRSAILDTVAALVDKSLVVREPEALGQARFRMLDTIREYAAEKLAAAGRDDAGSSTASATTRSPSPNGTSRWAWRSCPRPGGTGSTCSAGTTWTRATSGWCLASAWPRATSRPGCGICTAIRPCMLVRGEFALGCEWVDAFLALPEAAARGPADQGAGAHRARAAVHVDRPGRRRARRAGGP